MEFVLLSHPESRKEDKRSKGEEADKKVGYGQLGWDDGDAERIAEDGMVSSTR